MLKYSYLFLYLAFYSALVATLIVAIQNISKEISFDSKIGFLSSQETITYEFMGIYLMILAMLDLFYFTTYFLQKKIEFLVQLCVIKFISILLFIVLWIDLGYITSILILIVLEIFSIILLWFECAANLDILINHYNKRVGYDIYLISTNVISGAINTMKLANFYKNILILLYNLESNNFDKYTIFCIIRLFVFYTDAVFRMNIPNIVDYLAISSVLFGLLNVYGLIYAILIFVQKQTETNIIYLTEEVQILIITLSQLFLIVYVVRERKNREK